MIRGASLRGNKRGFSLVELMTVVAISSGLGLGLLSILHETTKVSHQMDRQAELTKDVQEFYFALEQYLGQTTHVVSCACGGVGSCRNAAFDLAAPPAPPNGIVLRFVYEDALDPITNPTSDCLFFGVAALPGTAGIAPQGCKKVLELVYTAPTDPPGAPGTATERGGSLVLQQREPRVVPFVIARLRQVTNFACTMTVNPPIVGIPAPLARLSNTDFKVRIDVKARQHEIDRPADQNYESWVPGGVNFAHGFRRSHIGQIVFRNLAIPGVQFGKFHSYKNCVRDGQPSADPQQCCSGYLDNIGNCLPRAGCLWNSTVPPVAAAAPGSLQLQRRDCCARMGEGANCL